jgi:hypothetical protein
MKGEPAAVTSTTTPSAQTNDESTWARQATKAPRHTDDEEYRGQPNDQGSGGQTDEDELGER